MEKLEKLFGIITTEDDLIGGDRGYSASDLRLRLFNSISGSSIMGIVLRETDDSFLVGLPAKLIAYGTKKVIEPHMPLPFIRMFKSTLLSILPCFGEFEIYYIRYILGEGKETWPEMVGVVFSEKLKERAIKLKDILEKASQEEKEKLAPKQTLQDNTEIDTNASIIMTPPGSKYKH